MHPIFRRVFNLFFGDFARKEDLINLYNQLAGFTQIQRVLPELAILRPLRGWAFSPDAICLLLAELQQRTNPAMVEFGSGQSTIVFASYFQRRGGGRLTSIEHDPEYAAKLKQQIDALGLAEFVELKVLALKAMAPLPSGEIVRSYDLEGLSAARIDVALVDGPAFGEGSMTRWYPLEWSLTRLAPGGCAFLDDAHRPREQAVLAEVARKWPNATIEMLKAEKGLARIDRIS